MWYIKTSSRIPVMNFNNFFFQIAFIIFNNILKTNILNSSSAFILSEYDESNKV